MPDSVPSMRYSSVCNVLRLWKFLLIPILIESTNSMVLILQYIQVWMTIVESEWNLWVWLVGVVSRRWVWLVGVVSRRWVWLVSLLMLIPSLILSLTNITAYLHNLW